MLAVAKAKPLLCFGTGFLAFWICGGMVYFALHYTTATNGILIYTTPPILILAIEAIWRGRQISTREVLGISIAILGAITIVLRGQLENLLQLQFNTGDLIFVVAAISWAIYSVLIKSDGFSGLKTMPLLALLAICGAITLFPFAAYETITTGNVPNTRFEWIIIAAIVFLSSLLSFLTFQYGVQVLGASLAGIFMYMLAPWGLVLAWAFLGETLEPFHVLGTALILGGIIIATLPLQLLRKAGSANRS